MRGSIAKVAIMRLKVGKAPGRDGIMAEMVKYDGESVIE